jgi:predicted ATPase
MTGRSQQDFRYQELDPTTLNQPFKVETNWHVITGAPSCGKTTLIDLLAERGFQTVPEIAHEYIEGALASGQTLEEIFRDRASLQRKIIALQIDAENKLAAGEVVFLDRGLPDCISFNRFVGTDPNQLLEDCFCHRYASVFILDTLPYESDGIRDIDAPQVAFLDEWLNRDYRALGYEVIRVPVLSPQERLDFILDRAVD